MKGEGGIKRLKREKEEKASKEGDREIKYGREKERKNKWRTGKACKIVTVKNNETKKTKMKKKLPKQLNLRKEPRQTKQKQKKSKTRKKITKPRTKK